MNENTDIFICCHSPKHIELPDQTYKIITSEHCNIQSNLNIIREPDNDITKISNKGFAELSRIWWVWNHVDLKNYVGFLKCFIAEVLEKVFIALKFYICLYEFFYQTSLFFKL